jgi:hypothetical protein
MDALAVVTPTTAGYLFEHEQAGGVAIPTASAISLPADMPETALINGPETHDSRHAVTWLFEGLLRDTPYIAESVGMSKRIESWCRS